MSPIGYVPAGGFQNGHWYHVVAVRSVAGNCVGLYVDGVSVASKTTSAGPIIRSTLAATIGRWTDGTHEWGHVQGLIDEARVYDRPLSAAEVRDHYNGGLGRYGAPSDSGLIAGWHFDESTGTTATDYGPS